VHPLGSHSQLSQHSLCCAFAPALTRGTEASSLIDNGVTGPVLLGLPAGHGDTPTTPLAQATEAGPWKELPRHRDEDQVQLDVNRAFIYYPESKSLPSSVPFCPIFARSVPPFSLQYPARA